MDSHLPAILPMDIARGGFGVVPAAFTAQQVARLLLQIQQALDSGAAGPIAGTSNTWVASRNVRQIFPSVVDWARLPILTDVVRAILGDASGLVRVLYFDKPPGQSWSLPWHKDRTIAVREHPAGLDLSFKPTQKAGVPHVEAPVAVLRQMLTARIHLDDVDDFNGPLLIVSGSHENDKVEADEAAGRPLEAIHARAGDVLFMRPLLTHCSRKSASDCDRHRRILHLEYAADRDLPHGLAWHSFDPVLY